MSEYQWRPVDGMRKEIRVLDLDPGTGTASLSGQLRHVFLDESDKADFITISYAWGDAALVDEVSVDGKIIPIPASAGSALRCMRSPVETHTFWIDCICIDQYNVQEKGHQVGLMADIFQYSTGTLAHLGDDHDNTAKRAFDGFLAVSEAWQESYRQQSDVTHAGIENIEIQNWSSLRETIDMAAIKAIMQKAYFTRLWIVQEAVLSSRTMLCCGTWSISLHAFAIAAIWFSFHPSSDFTDDVYEDEQLTNVESFLAIVNAVYHGELSLTKILHLAIWLQCSEPRDRVFGLLGLLKLSTQESSFLANLAPDYTKSVADVYSDATRACIAECNPPWALDTFGYKRTTDNTIEDLPPWLPNWYCGRRQVDFKHLGGRTLDLPKNKYTLWPREPRVAETTLVSRTQVGKILSIQGVVLDTITKHSNTSITLDEFTPHAFVSNALLLFCDENFPDGIEPTGRERLDRLEHVLSAGCQEVELMRWWLIYLLSFVPDSMPTNPSQEPTTQSTEQSIPNGTHKSGPHGDLPEVQGEAGEAQQNLIHAMQYCFGRKPFLSQSGSLGIGPKALQDGDVIAVTKLSQHPMILRRAESYGPDHYTVIGHAFIEGSHNGEEIFAAASDRDELGIIHLV